MTQQQDAKIAGEMKEVLAQDRDFLRPLVQGWVQELFEAEMDQCLGGGMSGRGRGGAIAAATEATT